MASSIPSPKDATRPAYIFAGYGNAGDHASLLGVRLFTEQAGRIHFFSSMSKAFLSRLKYRASNLIVGGGGLFQPVFESGWKSILESDIPFSIIGVGLAETPPSRPAFDRSLLRQLASRAEYTLLRDDATGAAFQEAGGNCRVSFCPSILVLDSIPVDQSKPKDLLLNVVHASDLRFNDISVEKVRSACQQLASKLSLKYFEINHETPFSHQLLALYDRAQLCISSRLHGCIFAFCRGTPCIPLACDRKTFEFYETHSEYKVERAADLVDRIPSLALDSAYNGAPRKKLDDILSTLRNERANYQKKLVTNGAQ